MESAIRVDAVSKRYRLTHGEARPRYRTLRESLVGAVTSPFRRAAAAPPAEDFWALRDVSFEIQPGEVVGVIGRNGAGKSTLLKILSRITKPTSGRIDINGRVGSLLEVGTGFHPELTGRENVYLNGSLLGMSRKEIDRKFDEIVAFAEVERFLDTPVKRYSSGMYVRLAFAVAAHLEPEILIIDEVLAVGDVAFQKKCMGKMGDIRGAGRTVLFVSHNMQAVAQLTQTCVVLSKGRVDYHGSTDHALALYRAQLDGHETDAPGEYRSDVSAGTNRLHSAAVITSEGRGLHRFGEPARFEFVLDIPAPSNGLCFSFQVVTPYDQPVTHCWMFDDDVPYRRRPGRYRLSCSIDRLRLYMGSYSLTTHLSDRRGDTVVETLTGICHFEVTMLHELRTEYDWHPAAAVYLEDCHWSAVVAADEPLG